MISVFWVLFAALSAPSPGGAADDVAPDCLDELSAFATSEGFQFDPARVIFAARWAAAGHEVRRLPGLTARLPQDHCGGDLAVDLSPQCRILKSRGEGSCKATFPVTYR